MNCKPKTLFPFLFFFFQIFISRGQENGLSNVNSVHIVTQDVKNYLSAYKKVQINPTETDSIYKADYFDKGSVGLNDYFNSRIKTVRAFVKNQQQKKAFYEAVSKQLENIDEQIPIIEKGFKSLKEIYSEAKFPDIYLLVGRWNSAGTVSDHGLLLSVDMISKSVEIPIEELNDWEKSVYKPQTYLPYVVIHELIHTLQHRPNGEPSLLKMAIREGMADFITELATGVNPSDHIYRWAKPHEQELWQAFRVNMYANEPNGWLYETPKNPDWIPDLGYFMGYEITKGFYLNSTDKKAAIKDLLTTDDYDMIFRKSNYEVLQQ